LTLKATFSRGKNIFSSCWKLADTASLLAELPTVELLFEPEYVSAHLTDLPEKSVSEGLWD